MEQFTLARSGLDDLRFSGESVAHVSGRLHNGQQQPRWHEIAVYRRDDGYWVVHVAYRTSVRGEVGNDYVEVINDASEVEPLLSLYNPAEHVAINASLLPPRMLPSEALRETIKQYDLLVCAMLKALPDEVKSAS